MGPQPQLMLIRMLRALPILGWVMLASCSADTEELGTPYAFNPPEHFPTPVYGLGEKSPSAYGFKLGKKLFYDRQLSSDGSVSCGSCHAQVHAFADHNTKLSMGVEGRLGIRNAPPVFNMAWHPAFMWDGGINHLEMVPVAPFTHPLEMNLTMAQVLQKVNQDSSYGFLAQQAFGTPQLQDHHLLKSLAQFMTLIVSSGSKYDMYLTTGKGLNALELKGLSLFRQHCSHCHSEPLLSDFSYRNNGLDSLSEDPGRAVITLDPADHGKFKVPSLRNAELTYPYMHDGRFMTLEQAIGHYRFPQATPNLDPSLSAGIPLSDQDIEALVAFIKSTTDETLISDTRWME